MADAADARRRAEEALAFMDAALRDEMPPLPTQVKALADAVRALLAAWPEAPPPPSDAVREAAERVRSLPPSTNEFNVAVANLLTALRANASPAPGSEGVREAWLVAESAPELNPSNYSHGDVCELNEAMIRVTLILRRAMGLGQLDAVRSLIAALSSPAAPAKDAVREAAEHPTGSCAETNGGKLCGRCFSALDPLAARGGE